MTHRRLPARRPLQIFAFDPMLGRTPANRIRVEVPCERLRPGPEGERLTVIDYDGSNRCFYTPVHLGADHVLMSGGLPPSESNPHFHQQMVYAVASRVLENFDRALGRRITFRPHKGRTRALRLFPHAFQGQNAFYDPRQLAIFFGYFRASTDAPGPHLPGQAVFTCLSQDIIAHETTHALVDRLRPFFTRCTNPDVAAFHEGFADLVAILQHFSFTDILSRELQRARGDLTNTGPLVELAVEFGYATGKSGALRAALDNAARAAAGERDLSFREARIYAEETEPHRRGALLVAAVFEAFLSVYRRRTVDLVRIATGGTGVLPTGDLLPDLVARMAQEAADTAQSVLTMCIRAFDYLPPIDLRFGDYLRALVTADYEMHESDDLGLRAALIEAFRARGIYPEGALSLSVESLLLEPPRVPLPPLDPDQLRIMLVSDAHGFLPRPERERSAPPAQRDDVREKFWVYLRRYGKENARALGLAASPAPEVEGGHFSFRIGTDGRLNIDLVVQFVQAGGADDTGGELLAGATLIASSAGDVRYVLTKPSPAAIEPAFVPAGKQRLHEQNAHVRALAASDPRWIYRDAQTARPSLTLDFALLHGGVR